MSETPSIRSRLLTTPLRDLLRLRLSGRLAWRRMVRNSALPADVRAVIERVAQRTRLWRLEKGEVTEELLSHFSDGLSRGLAPAMMIEQFGEERLAARLIRRAKVRNRPWAWHALRAARWAVALLLVYYGFLAMQFFDARPTVTVDYVEVVNRQMLQIPQDQRAWPLYRQAMLQMGMPHEPFPPALYEQQGHTPQLRQWIAAHASSIDLIRQGAARPALGFLLGQQGSIDDRALYPSECSRQDPSDHMIIMTLLPQLPQLHGLWALLREDADAAADSRDGERLYSDLVAQWQMADQLAAGPDQFLISSLVGAGMRAGTLDQIDRLLATRPGRLSDAQWTALAHRLAAAQTASDWIKFGSQRMFIEDMVQRIFSDDGHGNGHLTARGLALLRTSSALDYQAFSMEDVDHPFVAKAWNWTPVQVAMLAVTSRRDFSDRMLRVIDAADDEASRPLRDSDGRSADELTRQMKESAAFRVEYWPFQSMLFAFDGAIAGGERLLGHRDGVLVGISLELFRRHFGRYPAELAELVPQWLPAIPADRITGAPIKYRLIAGKPRVYSVGADRTDDGGEPVKYQGRPNPAIAGQWFVTGEGLHGDWILYPQSEFDGSD